MTEIETATRRPNDPPALRTRRPTGRVAYPLVLVEGEEKAGKTYSVAALSNSPRVGRTFIAELGEHRLDEYASLGRFELLAHNGTFGDLRDQLRAACSVRPDDPAIPNVVALDTGTALWNLLCDWTDVRARSSAKNRRVLEQDPDAEVVRGMNLWNDAKSRWRSIVDLLVAFEGIGIVVCRGKDVAVVENGEPTGAREWKVEAEKSLPADVTAWVRLMRGQPPRLTAVASLHVDVPKGGLELPRDGTLDHVLFEVLGAGAAFEPGRPNVPTIGVPVARAKTRFLDYLEALFTDPEDRMRRAAAAWTAAGLDGKSEVTEAEYQAALDAARPGGPGGPEVGGAPTADDDASPEAPAAEAGPALDEDGDDRPYRDRRKAALIADCERRRPPLPTGGTVEDLATRLEADDARLEAPFDPAPEADPALDTDPENVPTSAEAG